MRRKWVNETGNGEDKPTLIRKETISAKWDAGRTVSNDTSIFPDNEIGISKEIVIYGTKRDFLKKHLDNLRMVFDLSETQVKLLLGIVSSTYFQKEIIWDMTTITYLAKQTGLTPNTIKKTFPSLGCKKNLIKKVKCKIYKVNKDVLYQIDDLKNLTVAQLVTSYRFEEVKVDPLDFLKGGEAISEKFVEEVIGMAEQVKNLYNKQQRMEEAKKLREEANRFKQEEKENEDGKEKVNIFA